MLLAIDIGNTNITLGVWNRAEQQWIVQWRLRTVHEKTEDEYWIDLRTLLRDGELRDDIDRVVVSSVVPPLTRTYVDLCRRYLKLDPLQVTHATPMGISVNTENPAEVGADRIVNAAAAFATVGGPCIVIDMGTATTFDWISADGQLLGVIIAPGLRLAADALTRRAAQLSNVALEAPPNVLGRNTIHAVQSGLVYGYVSLIEGMVAKLSAELNATPTVLGTGGLISLITPHTDTIHHVDPWLTLTGLRIIADFNA